LKIGAAAAVLLPVGSFSHGVQQQRHGAEVREPAGALSAGAAVLWSSIRIVMSVIFGGLRKADRRRRPW